MLPGLSGPEIVRALRADGQATPALLLTARTQVRDKVEGLDAGADDHLAKPFELDELLAGSGRSPAEQVDRARRDPSG